MRKFINTAAFLGFVATGTMASAQGVLNNTANQVGNAVGRAAGQAQSATRGAADNFRNRVDDAAASSSPQSHGPAANRIDENGNNYARQGVRANVNQGVRQHNQVTGINGRTNRQHSYGYQTNGYGQTVNHFHGNSHGVTHHGSQMAHHGVATQGVHTLRYDNSGREFICVGGQRIYFDGNANTVQNGDQDRYESAYGNADQDYAAPAREGESTDAQDNDARDNDAADVNANTATNSDVGETTDSRVDEEARTNADANLQSNERDNLDTDLEGNPNTETNLEAGLTPDNDAGASTEVNSNLNGAKTETNVEAGVNAATDLGDSIN